MFEKPSNKGCKGLMELFDLWDCALDGGLDIPVKIDFTSTSPYPMTSESDTAPLLGEYEAHESFEYDSTKPVFDYSPSQYSEGHIFIIEVPEYKQEVSMATRFMQGIKRFFGRSL